MYDKIQVILGQIWQQNSGPKKGGDSRARVDEAWRGSSHTHLPWIEIGVRLGYASKATLIEGFGRASKRTRALARAARRPIERFGPTLSTRTTRVGVM